MGSLIFCLAWTTPINTAIIILACGTGLTKLARLSDDYSVRGSRGREACRSEIIHLMLKPCFYDAWVMREIEPGSNLVCKFQVSIYCNTISLQINFRRLSSLRTRCSIDMIKNEVHGLFLTSLLCVCIYKRALEHHTNTMCDRCKVYTHTSLLKGLTRGS